MSRSTKDAFDKGYVDGVKNAEEQKDGAMVNFFRNHFNSSYQPDKDHPEAYKEGFKQGRKNG